MTAEILLLLALLATAMVVFTFEWLAVDTVSILLVVALVLFGILTPQEAFSGFASEIIVILASIFVLSGALVRTGVMEWLGQAIYAVLWKQERKTVGTIMSLSAGLSAFLSNTNATAILMPAVMEYSKRSDISPSRLLIPLAYASMLGGSCTLIGTSTNLASSGLMDRLGLEPIALFEFVLIGLAMILAGTLYMVFVGARFLPRTSAPRLGEAYDIDNYLSEIVLGEESAWQGQALQETDLSERGIQVLAIKRGAQRILPQPMLRLEIGDVLVVQAPRESLFEVEERPGLRFESSLPLEEQELFDDEICVAEAIVMPGSNLLGRTPREIQFRQRFGASVLAIYRRGTSYPRGVGDLPLEVGDVMLLQAPRERLHALQAARNIWVVGEHERLPFRRRKGAIALAALIGAVVAGSLGWVPLSMAFLLGVLAVILSRCVAIDEIYSLIQWRVIVLIGGMTSFGFALQKTGAADYLADVVARLTMPLGVYAVMGAFVALTMLLTQPMSNAAAALVVLPVAVSTAVQLGLEPRTLAILVTLSASLSFIAPLEPACLLVYSPGKYRFRDFVLAGLPLSVIVFAVLLVLVPLLWPLGV